VGGQDINGSSLEFFGQLKKRLDHLEEYSISQHRPWSVMISTAVKVVLAERITRYLLHSPVANKFDLCRRRDALIVITDGHHHLGQNLGPTATLMNRFVKLFQGKQPAILATHR
jgi:hypothetical protein